MTGHPHARHLTDEELVLVYFDEFSDRPGAEAHLAVCESCRRGLADLGETLALVADHQEVEAPDGFERVMWARVERQLQDATPRGVAHLVRAASPRAGRRRGVTGAGCLRGRPLDHAARHPHRPPLWSLMVPGWRPLRSACCSAPPANTSIDRSGCWWSC